MICSATLSIGGVKEAEVGDDVIGRIVIERGLDSVRVEGDVIDVFYIAVDVEYVATHVGG